MTQAYNLSQLANNLNSSGQLDAADGLVNAVPVANGGTGATTPEAARTNLDVPSRDGGDATGNWNINAASADSASTLNTGSWTVLEESGVLIFKFGGVAKFQMDEATGFSTL